MMLISSNFLLGFVTQMGENIENILVTAIHFLSFLLCFFVSFFFNRQSILEEKKHFHGGRTSEKTAWIVFSKSIFSRSKPTIQETIVSIKYYFFRKPGDFGNRRFYSIYNFVNQKTKRKKEKEKKDSIGSFQASQNSRKCN